MFRARGKGWGGGVLRSASLPCIPEKMTPSPETDSKVIFLGGAALGHARAHRCDAHVTWRALRSPLWVVTSALLRRAPFYTLRSVALRSRFVCMGCEIWTSHQYEIFASIPVCLRALFACSSKRERRPSEHVKTLNLSIHRCYNVKTHAHVPMWWLRKWHKPHFLRFILINDKANLIHDSIDSKFVRWIKWTLIHEKSGQSSFMSKIGERNWIIFYLEIWNSPTAGEEYFTDVTENYKKINRFNCRCVNRW